MSQLSFLEGLYFGVIQPGLVHPFPMQGDEDREITSQLLDAFRQFAEENLDGGRFDREHHVPESVRAQLGEMGILGLTIPEEHGGAGLGYTTYCRIMEETNRYCGSTAVIVGGHQSIGIKALLLHGTEEQKKLWLPKLATGEWFAAYALSEPEAGSDPSAMRTIAEEQADGSYVLTGQKIWITNGGFADFFTVFAKTDDGQGGRKVTCFVLTPAELANGFRRGAEEKKMGLRGSSTTQLFLDGCRVPARNILGEKGRGLKVAFEVLNYGRTSLAAGCTGTQKRVLEESVRHATQRVQFGQPISEFELIQAKIAEMASDIHATETITYLTTGMIDRGDESFSLEGAACKIFSTEACWRTCNHGVQIAGGIAYVEEYPYERLLRDARINMIFEGTNEILHHFIGMNGVKRPGQALLEMGKGGTAPTPDALHEAGVRLPAPGAGRRFPGLSDLLAGEVARLEQGARDLGAATCAALMAHGRELVSRQLVQARLAEAGIDLYVGFACASRADALLRAKGPGAAAGELTIARKAIADALQRLDRSLQGLRANDDDLVRATSRVVAASQGWEGLVP